MRTICDKERSILHSRTLNLVRWNVIPLSVVTVLADDREPVHTMTHSQYVLQHTDSVYYNTQPVCTITHSQCVLQHTTNVYYNTQPVCTITHTLCVRQHTQCALQHIHMYTTLSMCSLR